MRRHALAVHELWEGSRRCNRRNLTKSAPRQMATEPSIVSSLRLNTFNLAQPNNLMGRLCLGLFRKRYGRPERQDLFLPVVSNGCLRRFPRVGSTALLQRLTYFPNRKSYLVEYTQRSLPLPKLKEFLGRVGAFVSPRMTSLCSFSC
jgi:hypothetical protein